MRKYRKLLLILILPCFCLTGCWAPIDSCLVDFEHVHSDYVSGVFSGRQPFKKPPKLRFLWDKNKGELNPNTDLETTPSRKKLRKKFPWERW
jgi:hypothetical protein